MRTSIFLGILSGFLFTFGMGCSGSDDTADTVEADTDTDADADTDTDADADTDSDADVCERNSGWPCACIPGTTCDDGSYCTAISGLGKDLGVCAPLCDPKTGECPDEDYTGVGSCSIYDDSGKEKLWYCVLQCVDNTDCPTFETCQELGGGFKICYP
jgi:hypothetical protein